MPANSQIHHHHDDDSYYPNNPNSQTTTTTFNAAVAYPKRNPNPKILSFILKSIIMLLVISFFFLFLGIAALAVLHLLLPTSRHHHRRPAASLRGGISPEDLQRCLPEFDYTAESGLEECAVCLEGYRMGDTCRRLMGCCHVYHSGCIDRWLAKVPNCPVCRTRVRLDVNGRGLESEDDESKVLWSV